MGKTIKNYIIVGASDGEEAVSTDKIKEIYDAHNNESFNEVFYFNTVEEIEKYEELEAFLTAMVNIARTTLKGDSKKGYDHIIINGVSGETDLFLWGIDIRIEGIDISYGFVDWVKSGQNIKFE